MPYGDFPIPNCATCPYKLNWSQPVQLPTKQVCPVCGGSGKYKEKSNTTACAMERQCHGCEGRGWI